MQRRPLGATGLELPVLGFGGAPLGDMYGGITEEEGARALHAAIDAGIDYVDVAPYYGQGLAEERLGRALAGRRDRVVISTKCARYGARDFDFSGPRIERSIDESLTRLRTDFVDLFLVHDVEFGDERQVLEETLPAMERVKASGKARFIGVTGLPVHLLARLAGAFDGVDVVLSYCHWNLLDRDLLPTFEPLLARRPLGLVNASPLHMGILSSAGPQPWHPAPEGVQQVGRQLADLCREHGSDVAVEALRFATRDPRIASTLVGIRRPSELEQDLEALAGSTDPELARRIEDLVAPVLGLTWHEGLPQNAPPGWSPSA